MELVANRKDTVTSGSWLALSVQSEEKNQIIDITALLNGMVKRSEIRHGDCHLFVPHPNAVIFFSVKEIEELDSLGQVELMMEAEEAIHRGEPVHPVGQASVNQTVSIEDGRLRLRERFGVYVCEYDGPRHLAIMVKIERAEPREEGHGIGN